MNSMSSIRTLAGLAPIAAFTLLSFGCIADPKSVGEEESESGGETETASSTGGESETASATTGQTESESETDTTMEACADLDAETCDIRADCGWVEVQTVMHSPDTCGFLNQPQGRCLTATYFGDMGCFSQCDGPESSGPGVFYREIDDQTGEYFLIEGCGGIDYDGFAPCQGPDANPICACACGGSGGSALPPGFENDITEQGGCSDMMVHARNADDTLGLILWIDQGLVATVTDSNEPLDVEVPATDFDRFELRLGTNVTLEACNDAIGDPIVVDVQWEPVGGTVGIHIEPTDTGPEATVTLTDIELQPSMGQAQAATIPNYTFDTITVGWLPG